MTREPATLPARVPPGLVRAARRQRAARLYQAKRERWAYRMRRLRRAVLASGSLGLAGIGASMVTDGFPDGTWLLLVCACMLVFVLLALFPSSARLRTANLDEADLPELAGQTEIWLEQRRRALPAPAIDAVDMIGVRLEALAPQLAAIDERGPAAREVRKLLTEHLPGLVDSYARIAPSLRHTRGASGRTPAEQLTEGLGVISGQLEAMSEDLSRQDVDALAIRNRYLETRYLDSEGGA